ncbi:uncharacterized protein BDR25DRAFT_307364 [Lindgomyces ingoldianus]|uniref:Uncharacterized protein n=1 Tax=Lindgomyces ingoldianus TaxID=673940 RepID=A0ACB6QBR0_9PLEO|nr:uncharacterized protein BDR25DRAFT_307364 [Lindgomyces ingoldianus]KAF2464033.1 hypothetical protein BDR25DRAFT_307364 [Lindgomyces ingoldianus]
MTLHPPTYNTIKIPRNKLRRQPHHPQLRAYLLAPDEGNYPDILYWLCGEHLQRAISKEICLSTLRCSGSIALGPTLPKHPALNGASFHFKATPALSRRNIIFHAEYELTFNCAPCRFWSEAYVRSLLLFFDLRCCLHCSTGQMQDEIICFLFHGPNTPLQQGVVNTCVRATDRLGDIEEGCGHHIHVCECATEYKIEPVRQLGLDVPVGVKVLIWQWLGHRSNDYVLRQKGVLRNLYEDAAMEMEWEASRTGIAEVVGD